MANPTKPAISFDYSGWQSEQQITPFPGSQLDIDVAELKRGVDDTIDALADVRRSDGALKNGIVTADSLAAGLAPLAAVPQNIVASFAAIAATTFLASVKCISTEFHSPSYADLSTLVGGASYRRASLADITAAGYPAASYTRSLDRYLPSGTSDDTNGGYWLLDTETATPQMFGVLCDGTDETTKLQAWLDYLAAFFVEGSVQGSKRGYAPAGLYTATTLTISRPLTIEGAGSTSTVFAQIANHADSLFKSRCAYVSADYYTGQSTAPVVRLANLRLRGGNQLASQAGQHGLDLQPAATNHLVTRVVLENVAIHRFAANNLYAAAWTGYVHATLCEFHNAGQDGIHLNSCTDFRFEQCNFFLNGRYGRMLSGCSFMLFTSCNVWSNASHGNYIYNASSATRANHTFIGGTVDRNKGHGWAVDLRATTQVIHIVGMEMNYNSADNSNTYDDINHASASVGTVYCSGVKMGRSFTQQVEVAEVTRYHAGYEGAGGLVVFDGTCQFLGGALVESEARSLATFASGVTVKRNGVVEGTLAVGTAATAANRNVSLYSAAGYTRSVRAFTGSSQRWEMGVSATSESGSNVGSDWYLNRYSDAGAYIDTPFSVNRATGAVSASKLKLNGMSDAVDDAAAASAGVIVGGVYRNGSVLMIRVA